MKFHVVTYGCQMNVRDSEAITALLIEAGHTRAADEQDADVLVVNTCSVRGKAEAKALGKLGLAASGARGPRPRLVGAMGCMVQRLQAELFAKVPTLDFAVGTHALSRLPHVIARAWAGEGQVLDVGPEDDVEALSGHRIEGPSAFVNVLLGCDRRCAYCIVPTVRGREWSRSGAGVVEEVAAVVAQGVRDVTLLGQSVMSYGRRNEVWPEAAESPGGFTEPFARLLEAVDAIPGLARLRFTSGHPSGCTAELARAMGSLKTVCEHLHLPCQSGSDRILGEMRRGYTTDGFREGVARLRAQVPGLMLTTDIIVGYPGETEADFEATRAFMDEIGFDNAFIFKYSPRAGTPAADLPDDVSAEEKLRRNQVLLEDQDRRTLRHNEACVGTQVEVLAEGPSSRNVARWSGRTRTNKIAVFDQPEGLGVGELVTLRVTRVTAQTLFGDVVA